VKKTIYLSSVILTSFLFISDTFAGDCVQQRKTPQAPSNIIKQTNPLESTTENIAAGKMLYKKEAKPLACSQCHGRRGKGNGIMARDMIPKPPDFSCQAMMKNIPDGQLFWIIKNGSKGTAMMSFETLKDNQIWQLVSYIRKLAK